MNAKLLPKLLWKTENSDTIHKGMILDGVDASFGGTLYSNCKFLGAQEPKIFASSRVPFNYFSKNSNLIQHSVFRYFFERTISSQSFFKLWNTELDVHFDSNLDLLILLLFGSLFIIFSFFFLLQTNISSFS